jgi:RND family efflux transporter MFP subunit
MTLHRTLYEHSLSIVAGRNLFGVTLFSALLATAACGGSGGQQAAGPGGPGGGAPAMPVQTKTVTPQTVEDSTEYVATIRSFNSATVRPQVEGQVTRVNVKSGDRVKAGQTLLRIDPARQQATVSSQAASRVAQEANLAYAKQQLERSKQLFAAGAISKQELESAETSANTADAQLKALSAQVQEQSVTLAYYNVVAPTTGVIGDVPVRVGDRVTTDTTLTTIDQNQQLEVYVNVPLEKAPELKLGLPLKIVDTAGNELAETKVTFISPRVDDTTQTVLAKGLLKGTDGNALRSAQFVRAHIVWKTTQSLVVPVVAALRLSGQYFVFAVETKDGKTVARQRPVKLGAIVGDDYLVVDGLKANEQIVVSGVQKLGDGAPIQPQAAAPAPKQAQATGEPQAQTK